MVVRFDYHRRPIAGRTSRVFSREVDWAVTGVSLPTVASPAFAAAALAAELPAHQLRAGADRNDHEVAGRTRGKGLSFASMAFARAIVHAGLGDAVAVLGGPGLRDDLRRPATTD